MKCRILFEKQILVSNDEGAFYSEHQEKMILFFEKTKSSVPENTLYYRALGYLASVYQRKKDYHMSNYLYSIVFEKCEPLRPDAGLGFHPEEDADMQITLRLTKSVEEKCALWTLRGYYVEEERAINEIYKLNPASPYRSSLNAPCQPVRVSQ